MSYQIYFLQDEDDAVRFLDALSELNAIIWTGSAFKLPSELKDEIKNQMTSYLCKYTIIPQTVMDVFRINDREASVDAIGIEFLICCKRNALNASNAILSPNSFGKPYVPVDMSGNAIDLQRRLYASSKALS